MLSDAEYLSMSRDVASNPWPFSSALLEEEATFALLRSLLEAQTFAFSNFLSLEKTDIINSSFCFGI